MTPAQFDALTTSELAAIARAHAARLGEQDKALGVVLDELTALVAEMSQRMRPDA